MKCYNCDQYFIVKRSFLTLFETKKYYICDTCLKKYPIIPNVNQIPLENFIMITISLLDNLYNFKAEAYVFEIEAIVNKTCSLYKEYFLVLFEEIRLSDFLIEKLSFLADSVSKPLLVIAYKVKN